MGHATSKEDASTLPEATVFERLTAILRSCTVRGAVARVLSVPTSLVGGARSQMQVADRHSPELRKAYIHGDGRISGRVRSWNVGEYMHIKPTTQPMTSGMIGMIQQYGPGVNQQAVRARGGIGC